MNQDDLYRSLDEVPNRTRYLELFEILGYNSLAQVAKGDGLKVALLDTGVDYTHPQLSKRFITGYSTVTGNKDDYIDHVGHGSYMAGLICGRMYSNTYLSNVQLLSVKVTDDYGNMIPQTLIDGIKYSILQNVNVICIAIATPEDIEELHEIIKYATDLGIVIVASVGNEPGTVMYPAAYEEVIAVAGENFFQKEINPNIRIDIAYPSMDMPSIFAFGLYTVASGSSGATALATFFVTALQSFKYNRHRLLFKPHEIRQVLAECSTDLQERGFHLGGYKTPSFNVLKERYKICL